MTFFFLIKNSDQWSTALPSWFLTKTKNYQSALSGSTGNVLTQIYFQMKPEMALIGF